MNESIPSIGLGRAVRTLRVLHGWQLTEMAEICGVDVSYISRLETDHRRPSIKTIQAISTAFGMSASDLLRLAEASRDEAKHRLIRG